MRWKERARCRSLGPTLFFGAFDESHAERVEREAQAKEICAQCEVVADCLEAGQAEEGIWGGLTDGERRRATQRARYSPPRVIETAIPTPDRSREGWLPLEQGSHAILYRRDSHASWHGSEFMVVRNGVVIKVTEDLSDAYTTYDRVL